jgi:hypothetical protein
VPGRYFIANEQATADAALEAVQRFTHRRLEPIRFIGGGARSDVWCQIFADMLGRTMQDACAPIRCCLVARQEDCSLSVHKHVDDLCATAPSLCVRGGNAGDSAAWPQPGQCLYLGECELDLVYITETEIIHMPHRNK